MLSIGKVNSTTVKEGFRKIKALLFGKIDVKTLYESMPFGDDARPPKGFRAIIAPTNEKGKMVVIGYINTKQLESINPGEKRIYATDETGQNLSSFVLCKNDGTIEINGNVDFMVRFGPLAESINEIKDDINNLKQILSAWTPTDGGAALKTALTAANYYTELSKEIDNAKIEEIKTQ